MSRTLFFILAPHVPIRAITRNITPTASITSKIIFNVSKFAIFFTVGFAKRSQIEIPNIAHPLNQNITFAITSTVLHIVKITVANQLHATLYVIVKLQLKVLKYS